MRQITLAKLSLPQDLSRSSVLSCSFAKPLSHNSVLSRSSVEEHSKQCSHNIVLSCSFEKEREHRKPLSHNYVSGLLQQTESKTSVTQSAHALCHPICSCFVLKLLQQMQKTRHSNGTRNRWKAFIVMSHAQVFFPRLVFFLRQQKVSGDRTCLSPSPDGCQ